MLLRLCVYTGAVLTRPSRPPGARSASFGRRLALRRFVPLAVLVDDGQRVGFCIKDPVLQWEEVVVGEEQVQIPEQRGEMHLTVGFNPNLGSLNTSVFCGSNKSIRVTRLHSRGLHPSFQLSFTHQWFQLINHILVNGTFGTWV